MFRFRTCRPRPPSGWTRTTTTWTTTRTSLLPSIARSSRIYRVCLVLLYFFFLFYYTVFPSARSAFIAIIPLPLHISPCSWKISDGRVSHMQMATAWPAVRAANPICTGGHIALAFWLSFIVGRETLTCRDQRCRNAELYTDSAGHTPAMQRIKGWL